LAAVWAPTPASAQVAFFPEVSSFPNGVAMSATPVVSADRRYVRLTLTPQFTALEGFDTFSVPAAVSGVGAGGPGGLRSVAVPGPTFVAGMDGIVTPDRPAFPPTASPDAASFLSGSDGLPVPPRLARSASPGLGGSPRAKPPRRSARGPRAKRPATPRR